MNDKRIRLFHACKFGVQVCNAICGYCAEISIAGSTRRLCPMVHDVDIVCIPLDIPGIKARCKRNDINILADGQQHFRCRTCSGMELDIYFARIRTDDLFKPTPTNYGSLLVCRTGPKEFNIALIQHAKSKGLEWKPYNGVYKEGELIACETEQHVFHALELPFIPPEKRTANTLSRFPDE